MDNNFNDHDNGSNSESEKGSGIYGDRFGGEHMPVRTGYACVTMGVPGTSMKSCTLKNLSKDTLADLISHNLESLGNVIEYNRANDILLYRISSDIVPFGSSPANTLNWRMVFSEKLAEIGGKITGSGMRVSMHPGQYTVLNSPDKDVASRAVEDLAYHAGFMDSLGLDYSHKIILHTGGAYGEKKNSAERFISRFRELDKSISSRIALENDDRSFNIRDVLEIAGETGLPVVYDNLHNLLNPSHNGMDHHQEDTAATEENENFPGEEYADSFWISKCAGTWKQGDGPQKIHYSQQAKNRRAGSHSDSINSAEFLDFRRKIRPPEDRGRRLDIMLEVKDKNISALKCINLIPSQKSIRRLEEEWGRYKYAVLEKSQRLYNEARQLLKDKKSYPAEEFYRIMESAAALPDEPKQALNAVLHVWGYFKNKADESEKKDFKRRLDRLGSGDHNALTQIRNFLFRLASKYQDEYLLRSYYFL